MAAQADFERDDNASRPLSNFSTYKELTLSYAIEMYPWKRRFSDKDTERFEIAQGNTTYRLQIGNCFASFLWGYSLLRLIEIV